MRTELFDYNLPPELIASRPPTERDGGRLCVLERHGVRHARVRDWVDELRPHDLVVLNETRVRRARLACRRVARGGGDLARSTGGRVELLFLKALSHDTWEALGRANRPLREGDELCFGELSLQIVGRGVGGTVFVRSQGDLEEQLEIHGAMPIPPYMVRSADEDDVQRYQTVFGTALGSAAAPTAGLHLTAEMLGALSGKQVRTARIVLHVGVGTFRPVTAPDLDDHTMHSEARVVGCDVVSAVRETRERGGRVIAVGTTVVRALESSLDAAGQLVPTVGETELLIQPGFRFSVVDALLTNFHQPKSTLLALVSAFAGRDRVLSAYVQAVHEEYRFLSYGDAMWIPSRWAETP